MMMMKFRSSLNLRHLITKHRAARARKEGSPLPQFLAVSELEL